MTDLLQQEGGERKERLYDPAFQNHKELCFTRSVVKLEELREGKCLSTDDLSSTSPSPLL
jgi:hypothetical protein